MTGFDRLSLTRQFLLASFPVLLVGMLAIGFWVEREIERGVVARIGDVQGLHVDGLVAPHLRSLLERDAIDSGQRAELDAIFANSALREKIVAFVLWRPDGRVLYSNESQLIGRAFPIDAGLADALAGRVHAKLTNRGDPHHVVASEDWPARLIEIYAPVRAAATGGILGVAEFYQTTDGLDAAMAGARLRSRGVVIATTLATYLLLFGLVRRANRTIEDQRQELRQRVTELSALLAANERLDATVRRAAARTTSLNERFLRRVAADLHDGPAQDLGFAQMRLVSMTDAARDDRGDTGAVTATDLAAVRTAIDTAMADLRSISAGMQLPELDRLTPAEVAARAVRDYERKTGASVACAFSGEARDAPLPVKITVYRALQELLANGFRHAQAAGQHVSMVQTPTDIAIEVVDRGPGFDVAVEKKRDRGGLAGMRERVQVLGGRFELQSTPGAGTVARVRLPLHLPESSDE
ncbi:MAG: ATP-binding protein [Betaproteobacteria bacterium]